MSKRILLVAALGLVLLIRPATSGEKPAPAPKGPLKTRSSDKWSFELTPMYLWAPSVEGTMGVKGMSVPMDLSFSDVLDSLELVGTVRLEGHKGRWGFFIDGTYMNLSQEIEDPEAPSALKDALPSMSLPKPKIPAPMFSPGKGKELLKAILKQLPPAQRKKVLAALIPKVKGAIGKLKGAAAKAAALKAKLATLRLPSVDEIDIEMTLVIVEAGLSYLVCEVPLNATETRILTFELLGGGRYMYLKNEVDIKISPGSFGMLPSRVSIEKSIDWLEPMVGGRVKLLLSGRFGLVVRGDMSGFGIGSGSQLTWSVLGGVQYRLSERTTLSAGYRHFDLDYERGDLVIDIKVKGPIFGLTIHF